MKRNAEIFEASLLSVHRAREDITWIRPWGTFQNAGGSHTRDKRVEGGSMCVFPMSLIASKLGPQLGVFRWVSRTLLKAVTECEGSFSRWWGQGRVSPGGGSGVIRV